MKNKILALTLLVSLIPLSSFAARKGGTDLGNGGDGLLIIDTAKHTKFIYDFDLGYLGIFNSDHTRLQDPRYYSKENMIDLAVRLTLKKVMNPNQSEQSQLLDETCYEDKDGKCLSKITANTVDRLGQARYLAIADALAYHLRAVNEKHPALVNAAIDELAKLRFRIAVTVIPNQDTVQNEDDFNDGLKSLKAMGLNAKRIGCARRDSDNYVELSHLCAGDDMPLSHIAALLLHESLYALLVHSGIDASPDASATVRHVVSEVFQASTPGYEVDNALLSLFEEKIANQ